MEYKIKYVENDSKVGTSPSVNVPGAVRNEGINTKMHFISDKTKAEEIRPLLEAELKEQEDKLVNDYKLKNLDNIKVLLVRKPSEAIKKVLKMSEEDKMIIFVGLQPAKNPVTLKYEYTVYGYKSVTVTEEPK